MASIWGSVRHLGQSRDIWGSRGGFRGVWGYLGETWQVFEGL